MYKSCKDTKSKTGRGPTRFTFFQRMDEILGDSPTNSSPHSIDVDKIPNSGSSSGLQNQSHELELDEDNVLNRAVLLHEEENRDKIEKRGKSKRKNPTIKYINIKKRYLEKKLKINGNQREKM